MISHITTTFSYHHEVWMGVAMVNLTPISLTNGTHSLCIYLLDYHHVSPYKSIPNLKVPFQIDETLVFVGLPKLRLIK